MPWQQRQRQQRRLQGRLSSYVLYSYYLLGTRWGALSLPAPASSPETGGRGRVDGSSRFWLGEDKVRTPSCQEWPLSLQQKASGFLWLLSVRELMLFYVLYIYIFISLYLLLIYRDDLAIDKTVNRHWGAWWWDAQANSSVTRLRANRSFSFLLEKRTWSTESNMLC